jgi:protein-tyrosine phosphatase
METTIRPNRPSEIDIGPTRGTGEPAAADPRTVAVLFVCMGNICRSPLAEGVFRTLVAQAGLQRRVEVDSAGTHGSQLGEPPDPRAVAAARRRGYELSVRRARKFAALDFARFNWILAMDRYNLRELQALRPISYRGHLGLLLELEPELSVIEVPDPYYGAARDFDRALDLVEQGAEALLLAIRKELAGDKTP